MNLDFLKILQLTRSRNFDIPAPAKSFGSLRLRLHNTGSYGAMRHQLKSSLRARSPIAPDFATFKKDSILCCKKYSSCTSLVTVHKCKPKASLCQWENLLDALYSDDAEGTLEDTGTSKGKEYRTTLMPFGKNINVTYGVRRIFCRRRVEKTY